MNGQFNLIDIFVTQTSVCKSTELQTEVCVTKKPQTSIDIWGFFHLYIR
jgi:hypothetical protein